MNFKEMSDLRCGWNWLCRISTLWKAAVRMNWRLGTPVKRTRGCTLVFAPGCTMTGCTGRQAPGGSLQVRQHFQVLRSQTSFWGRNDHHEKHMKDQKWAEMLLKFSIFQKQIRWFTRWPYVKMISPNRLCCYQGKVWGFMKCVQKIGEVVRTQKHSLCWTLYWPCVRWCRAQTPDHYLSSCYFMAIQ